MNEEREEEIITKERKKLLEITERKNKTKSIKKEKQKTDENNSGFESNEKMEKSFNFLFLSSFFLTNIKKRCVLHAE